MKVLETFIEKYHNNKLYEAGEEYPAEGFKADPERVKFLQAEHPEYKVKFLEKKPTRNTSKSAKTAGEE